MLQRLLTFLLITFCISIAALAQHKQDAKPVVQQIASLPKIDYQQIGAPMPDLVVTTVDSVFKSVIAKGNWWDRLRHKQKLEKVGGKVLTSADFASNANFFVMIFNPTCSHCVEETEILKRNLRLFSKTKIVLLANPRVSSYIPDFIKQRELKDNPIITVGIDSLDFQGKVFMYRALPQINIYSNERKLLKVFTGDVPIDSLKSYIQ